MEKWATVGVVAAAALLAAASLCCGSKSEPAGDGGECGACVAEDSTVDGRRSDVALEVIDAPGAGDLAEDTVDTSDAREVNICAAPPPPACGEGQSKCTSGNTEVRFCQFLEETCSWTWSAPEPCPENTLCQEDAGCVCKYGACQAGDELDEACTGKALDWCHEWQCDNGCCWVDDVDCPEYGCNDCINLETGEIVLMDGVCPEGFIDQLCTHDYLSDEGECVYLDKLEADLCDDGDKCTWEECDPSTGDCLHTSVCDPLCWGETENDADSKCDDGDECTYDYCQYGGGWAEFSPWHSTPNPAEFDLEDLPEGLGLCANVDILDFDLCDDGSLCTDDFCDPNDSCCSTDQECVDYLEPGPCIVAKCYLEQNLCYELDVDCDDGDPCTTDSCDENAPDGDDPCVHEVVPDC